MPVPLRLKVDSSDNWALTVLQNFDLFLTDHAANERKASAMAISLAVHYPDRMELVGRMVDLAVEELNHYRQVMRIMLDKGIVQKADEKDPYVNRLLGAANKASEAYFLDRLLIAAVVEARGAERFELLSRQLTDADMRQFYTALAQSESRHYALFLELATTYFEEALVIDRLEEWLSIEKDIVVSLPLTGKLH